MRRALLIGAPALIAGLLVVFLLHQPARSSSPSNAQSMADITSQCASSVDSSGFGRATIGQDLTIQDETASIAVNCTLHVLNGASFKIHNSHLTTQGLVISDDGPGTAASTVEINDSTLSAGTGNAAIIQMRRSADTVAIHASTLDYPFGILIAVGSTETGAGAGGGSIEVIGSTMRSMDSGTQGIRLLAATHGGTANFSNDDFHTTSTPEQLAVLWAGSCHQANVTGAVPVCSPSP